MLQYDRSVPTYSHFFHTSQRSLRIIYAIFHCLSISKEILLDVHILHYNPKWHYNDKYKSTSDPAAGLCDGALEETNSPVVSIWPHEDAADPWPDSRSGYVSILPVVVPSPTFREYLIQD